MSLVFASLSSWVKIATIPALMLSFATSHPPYNRHLPFQKAINGTFYDPKTQRLAALLFVNGRFLGQFPTTSTPVRAGIVCLQSGHLLVGYFKIYQNQLYFSHSPLLNNKGIPCDDAFWKITRWALTGGGLFLYEGRPVRSVSKKEHLPSYIIHHPRYSFLLIHHNRQTITLGISYHTPPEKLAQQLQGKYYALLRLDGGSSTRHFSGKLPPSVNNAIGLIADQSPPPKASTPAH